MDTKSYKPTYAMTYITDSIFASYYIAVAIIPLTIFGAVILEGFELLNLLLMNLILPLILFVVLAIIPILVNLISKIFTIPLTSLNEEELVFRGIPIKIKDIIAMNLDLGFVGRYGSSRPASLTLLSAKIGYITIERPSFMMLLRLRKISKNVKIKIEKIEKKLLLYPLIIFVCSLLFFLLLFSCL